MNHGKRKRVESFHLRGVYSGKNDADFPSGLNQGWVFFVGNMAEKRYESRWRNKWVADFPFEVFFEELVCGPPSDPQINLNQKEKRNENEGTSLEKH